VGARFLLTHHSATLEEEGKFWLAISRALVNASAMWIMYLALEPWVRRRWPHTIIGWSRFTARGIRDPLVGRDMLYGMGFGLVLGLIQLAGTALHGNSGQPFLPPLAPLLGVRYEMAGLLNAVNIGLFTGLLVLFLLFVLRVVLRNQWIAAAVYAAVLGFIRVYGTTTGWVDYPVALALEAVFALILLRFGLTAAIAASVCLAMLEACPAAPEFSVWYAGLALIPPAVVALIAVYGFRIARAGRPLIQPELE